MMALMHIVQATTSYSCIKSGRSFSVKARKPIRHSWKKWGNAETIILIDAIDLHIDVTYKL